MHTSSPSTDWALLRPQRQGPGRSMTLTWLHMLLCAMLWLLVSSQAAAQPVSLTPSSPLGNATVGVVYNQTITANGGTLPYTYAITAGALPAGMTLSSTGILSGTPAAGGSFSFTGTGPYTSDPNYTLTISTLPLPYGVCPWAEAEQALEMI